MSSIVMPPAWPLPRTAEPEQIEFQLDWLRTEYPHAGCWYAEKCGTWMAAPAGATRLIEASTAVALAARLAEHYHRCSERPQSSAVPRPARRSTLIRAGELSMSVPQGSTLHGDRRNAPGRHILNGHGNAARLTQAPASGTVSPDVPLSAPPPEPATSARRSRDRRTVLGAFWSGMRHRLGLAVGAAA